MITVFMAESFALFSSKQITYYQNDFLLFLKSKRAHESLQTVMKIERKHI